MWDLVDKVTGTGYSLSPSQLSASFHHWSVFIHVLSGGWTVGLLASTVSWRHSLSPVQQERSIYLLFFELKHSTMWVERQHFPITKL
jgi:hypothetical protein